MIDADLADWLHLREVPLDATCGFKAGLAVDAKQLHYVAFAVRGGAVA